MLATLLSSALRYTHPSGRVTVSLGASHHRSYLGVADSGPGISGEELGSVFDRFFRIRQPAVRVLAVTDEGDHSWSQHWAGYGEELWVTQLRVLGIRLTVTSINPQKLNSRPA